MASRAALSIVVEPVRTEKELYEYIKNGLYAGAAADPKGRAKQHERNLDLFGKRVMYCWKTPTSMKKAENRLLKQKSFKLNDHDVSNADDKPGFVYIIV